MKTILAAVVGIFSLFIETGNANARDQGHGEQPLATIPVRTGDAATVINQTPVSYRFVELRYGLTDIEDTDIGIDALSLRASLLIAPSFYVVGLYGRQETDDLDSIGISGTVEADTLGFGVGFRERLSDSVDLNTTLEMIRQELEGTGELEGLTDEDSGYRISAGLRGLVTPRFELSGSGAFVSIFNDHDSVIAAGALYHLNNLMSFSAGISVDSDSATYTAGVRLNF